MMSNRTKVSFYALLLFLVPLTVSAQMTWTCATDSARWSGRGFHASIAFDNKMWVLGGALMYPPAPTPLGDVWYSADGISWNQVIANAQWPARWSHTSVVFDNQMWVVGGYSDYGTMNDVWHSTAGMNWIQATANAGWSARSRHTSIVYDNKIWVVGGMSYNGIRMNDVWYSTDGVSWTQATPNAQWSARGGHTSVVFDNKMWVIGGQTSNIGYVNDVWYSTDGVNWIQATANAGWSVRGYHTSIVFAGKMWVMGGTDGWWSKNDVWCSPDGIAWIQATDSAAWHIRYGHTSVVLDNQMWVIGGGRSCDVWYSTGLGIEEQNILPSNTHCYNPTIFRGPFRLPEGKECRVFDIAGRVVEPSKIQAGIYFVEVDGVVTQKVVRIR